MHTKLNTLCIHIFLITEGCKAEQSHILVNTVHTIKTTSITQQKLFLPPIASMTKSQLNTQLLTTMMNLERHYKLGKPEDRCLLGCGTSSLVLTFHRNLLPPFQYIWVGN